MKPRYPCLAALVMSISTAVSAAEPLVIHEWGTFTALQDERGRAVPGINVDDEPLPAFVHRLSPYIIDYANRPAPRFQKGVARSHPRVTLRLETPVIYFHPSAGEKGPITLDLRVEFRGGWVTEHYPRADVAAPGFKDPGEFGELTGETVGSITWNNLRVGGTGEYPQTDSKVWLAPRKVDAATVAVPASGSEKAQSERYLFYRGVGSIEAPLAVKRSADGATLSIESLDAAAATLRAGWLVDIREDGSAAFRAVELHGGGGASPRVLGSCAAAFAPADYTTRNLDLLRRSMRGAIVADGLFADETEALLATWDYSYFRSPGLRLFFLVPRAWTDAVLPLRVSIPAGVVRTMVGRIEVVTPRQRELVGRIATEEAPDPGWFNELQQRYYSPPLSEMFSSDEARYAAFLKAMTRECPPLYGAYLDLGRFRNAILQEENRRRPTGALRRFMSVYGLAE
jgi:hypothetical protein